MDEIIPGRPHSNSVDVYDWLLDSETGSRASFDVNDALGDDANDLEFNTDNIVSVPVAKVLKGPLPASPKLAPKTKKTRNTDGNKKNSNRKKSSLSTSSNNKKDNNSKSSNSKNNSNNKGDSNNDYTVDLNDDKVLSRLEKNRQSARDCRRRKKERVKELEERVKRLERQNRELRVQLRIGRESAEADEAEKWRITNQIRELVKKNESDATIAQTIDMFKDRYADYGQERRSTIRYHIDQLEDLLQPTIVTKMGLWSLHQEDDFYKDKNSIPSFGQSIWNILCDHLEVTEMQKRRIISYRSRIRNLCSELKGSMQMLSNLRGRVESKNVALEKEMQEIQSILTPTQSGKFVLWVSDNPACMQMLDQLWGSIAGTKGGEDGPPPPAEGDNNYYDQPKPHLDEIIVESNNGSSGGDERGTKRVRESKIDDANISKTPNGPSTIKKVRLSHVEGNDDRNNNSSSSSSTVAVEGK